MGTTRRPNALRALACALLIACSGEPTAPGGGATGAIRVTLVMTGLDFATRYVVVVGDRTTSANANVSATIFQLPPGTHDVHLQLPSNCQAAGSNPREAIVVAKRTTVVEFVATCAAATGGLRISTRTTGTDIDQTGYQVRLDGYTVSGDPYARGTGIEADGTVILTGVPAGDIRATLTGLAVNCDPAGANPRTISVVAADTVALAFDAVCVASTHRLVYVSELLGEGGDLYVVNANGSANTRLTTDLSASDPAWSPDGRQIAFTADQDGNRDVYVIDADGSNPRRLTDAANADYHPAWSPDGTRIAFVSERAGNAEIYVMDVDGTNPVRLTNHGARDTEPAWSPDGRRIAFSSERSGLRAEVYVMDVAGSEPVRVTTMGGRYPAWSPDGTRLAYSSTICPWFGYGCYAAIFIQAGTESPVSLSLVSGERPAWSPDGRKLAYRGYQCDFYLIRCDPVGVQIARADGTDIVGDVSLGHSPAWRP